MRCTARRSIVVSMLVLSPAVGGAAWRAEGPFLADVDQVVFAPSQPATVYAATDNAGVWRSDDGGRTWTLPGDEMTSRDVVWLAVNPADAKAVWAGLDDTDGAKVWRSADGGATWKPLDAAYAGGRVEPVGQPLAFAPSQPQTILLPSTNLHYRSDDGGATWRDFRVPNQDAYVFAVDPHDPKTIYAGGRGENLNVSRSVDGGKSWKQIGVGLGENSLKLLVVDPHDAKTLYAAGSPFASLFKSTDRGENWTPVALPVGSTDELFGFTIDPGDSRVLWAATKAGLFESKDGGANWSESDRGLGAYLAKHVAVDPRDRNHLLAATGGTGVYESRDGGASWAPANGGLAGGWAKRLWGAPGGGTLFAQLSVGLFRLDGAGAWSEVTAPFESNDTVDLDGMLFDAASPGTLYAFDTQRWWRSGDGGRSWQEVEQKGPSMRDMMKGNTESAQFAALAQEAGSPKTFYAGSASNDGPNGAVYKSTDGGKKWSPSGKGLPGGKVGLLRAGAPRSVFAVVDGKTLYRTTDGGGSWSAAGDGLSEGGVNELAVDPRTPTRLFAATEKGLFLSTDSGASWSRVGEGGLLEGDDVEAVAIDPASGAVYAGNFHGVFRSADGGASWQAMSAGLPNVDVRTLVVAGAPARLWAGIAGGSVYSTELP